MQSRVIYEGAQRSFAVVFNSGEELVAGLTGFARANGITAAAFTGLGALQDVVLGYFDWQSKSYRRIPITEQVEVVSLLGNMALDPEGKPSLHPHIVVSKSDGSAWGGHLLEGHVRPVAEIVVTELPAHLQRRKDPASGLALIRL